MNIIGTVPCSRCGCTGIHACTGRPLEPITKEQEERLTNVLKEIFEEEKNADQKEM